MSPPGLHGRLNVRSILEVSLTHPLWPVSVSSQRWPWWRWERRPSRSCTGPCSHSPSLPPSPCSKSNVQTSAVWSSITNCFGRKTIERTSRAIDKNRILMVFVDSLFIATAATRTTLSIYRSSSRRKVAFYFRSPAIKKLVMMIMEQYRAHTHTSHACALFIYLTDYLLMLRRFWFCLAT